MPYLHAAEYALCVFVRSFYIIYHFPFIDLEKDRSVACYSERLMMKIVHFHDNIEIIFNAHFNQIFEINMDHRYYKV